MTLLCFYGNIKQYMTDENKNPLEHPALHALPDLLPAKINGRAYAAMEYAQPGQRLSIVNPDRGEDIAIGPQEGQITAEVYDNGIVRLHLVAPAKWAQYNGDLARTRVVTVEAISPTNQNSAEGKPTVPFATAYTTPAWVGEHSHQLTIGQNGLEKVIIFQGEDNQVPLEQMPPTDDFDNDFQEIVDYLQHQDVKEAIDSALKEHGRPRKKGLFGRFVRHLADIN